MSSAKWVISSYLSPIGRLWIVRRKYMWLGQAASFKTFLSFQGAMQFVQTHRVSEFT